MKLSLQQISRPAGVNCVVYCDRQANFYLDCAESVLVRVQTPDAQYHFMWQDKARHDKLYAAFYEDHNKVDNGIVYQLAVNEVFCHNGECYYLAENSQGTKSIRLIDMYSSQDIIERIAFYDNLPEPVEDIYMEKIYRLDNTGKHFLTAAWTVLRGSTCDRIPVFEDNNDEFQRCLEGLHVAEPMRVGEFVTLRGKLYVLQRDEYGKLYLAELPMRFRSQERQPVKVLPKEVEDKAKKAKIIALKRNIECH